ncbi:MAG: hypothetical protein H8K04_18070 [Nitrospira sp.]
MSREGAVTSELRRQACFHALVNVRGVCLTELMISLTVGAAVLAAVLSVFNVVHAHAEKQHRTLKLQQDLRLGLEVFEQEARLATAESIVTVTPDEFVFQANLSAYRTTTTGAILPGQSVIPVQDGRGWGEGKTILVCGPGACESHRLSRGGQRYQLALAEPVGVSFPAGAAVEVHNRVLYYVKHEKEGTSNLMRMVDGGASTLIGELDDVRFSYWSEMGQETNQPSQVKRIVLEIQSNQSLHRMAREVSIRS